MKTQSAKQFRFSSYTNQLKEVSALLFYRRGVGEDSSPKKKKSIPAKVRRLSRAGKVKESALFPRASRLSREINP